MPKGMIFWMVMFLWVLFSVWTGVKPEDRRAWWCEKVVVVILFGLLGWAVFGEAVK